MPQVNPKFQQLIPPLSHEEFSQLEENILLEGIRDSIILWNDYIIDGHNRFEIAMKHGIDYKTIDKHFDNENEVILWIIDNQLGRRNIDIYTRSVLALKKEDIIKGIAKENMSKGGKGTPILAEVKGDSRDKIAEMAGVSHGTIDKVKKIEEKAPESVKQAIKEGKTTINKAYKDIKSVENKEKRIETEKTLEKLYSDDIRLLHGDFREQEIENESIDLIITDPPYPKEYLPLWNDLAIFADEKLKAGGFLVAYSGQMYLPEVISFLSSKLVYRWCFSLIHKGQSQVVNGINVMCGWKPILIFQKPPTSKFRYTSLDTIVSEKEEKGLHEWQQSESGVEKLIELFSLPNDVLCDPFMGAGTFPFVAKNMKRRVIGIEIDDNHFITANSRCQ